MSTYLQDVFMSMLLNEKMSAQLPEEIPASISINATRARKNITISDYMMRRLITLMGGEAPARQFIHEAAHQVKVELESAGAINESGRLCNGAENSTWSRKVHNKIFHYLLKLSGIPEVGALPDIFSIKMNREIKRETISHKKSV